MATVNDDTADATKVTLSDQAFKIQLPTLVLGATCTKDGKTIYASCVDGVYRVNTDDKSHEKLYSHDSYASGAVYSDQHNLLITAGYDGNLIWYDLANKEIIRKIPAHNFWSWKMAISSDHSMVASVSGQYLAGDFDYRPKPADEPTVKVYDTQTGACLHAFDHLPSVQSVAFSHDGKHLAAGNLMGGIRVWNLETGELAADWTDEGFTSWGIIKSHCYIGGIYGLDFTRDNTDVLATGFGPMRDPMAGNGKQLWQRWRWNQDVPEKVAEKQQGSGLMESIQMHAAGEFFVMAGRLRDGDANISLFSTATNERIAHAKVGFRITEAIFPHENTKLIVVGGSGQPRNADGNFPNWGHIHIYELTF